MIKIKEEIYVLMIIVALVAAVADAAVLEEKVEKNFIQYVLRDMKNNNIFCFL